MNVIDIVVLSVLCFGAIKGFIKGAISEVAGLLGIILGIWGGLNYSNELWRYLNEIINNDTYEWITFPLIFISVYLAAVLIGKVLTRTLKTLALNPINRLLGFVIGTSKLILIVLVFCTAYELISIRSNKPLSKTFNQSKTYQAYQNTSVSNLAQNCLDSW